MFKNKASAKQRNMAGESYFWDELPDGLTATVYLSKKALGTLDTIVDFSGAKSREEATAKALKLYEWLVDTKRQGNQVYIGAADNRFQPITHPSTWKRRGDSTDDTDKWHSYGTSFEPPKDWTPEEDRPEECYKLQAENGTCTRIVKIMKYSGDEKVKDVFRSALKFYNFFIFETSSGKSIYYAKKADKAVKKVNFEF